MSYFEGAYTALVTPFVASGEIDWTRLDALVESQIAGGIDGILPVGTTGESPTLNHTEHMAVIDAVVKKAAGRCKIIAGTGANSTAEAVALTQEAKRLGVDGTLQVTPYYNKPNQRGLLKHFETVAEIGVPVVLYNVPGRSAMPIAIDTIVELAKHPHIVSVKEAAGSVDRVSAIKNVCNIEILSGDDALTLPMMSVGACGVISVASNVIPREVSELVRAAATGDFATALELHRKYYQLFCDMFVDTNPIPIKAALAMQGKMEEVYRLPLCPLSEENKTILRASMQKLELL